MPLKLGKCQEVVTGNGHTYVFSGTLGRTEAFCDEQAAKRGKLDEDGNLVDYDVTEFSYELTGGKMPIARIKSYLAHTMYTVDGSEGFDPVFEADRFVEDMGLEDSAAFCTLLLHHAIVGNVKKKREDRSLIARIVLAWILTRSRKRSWLLVGILAAGVIAACTSFNLDTMLIALLME